MIGSGIRCVLNYAGQREVNLRVGISFVSVANARAYVEREAGEKTFEQIRHEAEQEWERVLSAFAVSGGSEEQRRTFYSMLYRLFCMPTDLGTDEENPFWKSGVRQFTDFYCLWDSIRNANSFFHLFFPELSRDMLNSLLDIAEHTGWLPDAHLANQHGYMQSACACDILFPEAALKGITGIDYQKALCYLRKNNETPTPDVLVKGRYSRLQYPRVPVDERPQGFGVPASGIYLPRLVHRAIGGLSRRTGNRAALPGELAARVESLA